MFFEPVMFLGWLGLLVVPVVAIVAVIVWSPLGRALASVIPPILATAAIALPLAYLLNTLHVAQWVTAACALTAIVSWSPLGKGMGDAIRNLADPARSRKALSDLEQRLADAETEIGHLREAAVVGSASRSRSGSAARQDESSRQASEAESPGSASRSSWRLEAR